MSYYKIVGGQKLDRALLAAFERSIEGQGDGRISGSDVESEIKKRAADGKGLTKVEIDTLRYAASEFNVTSRGKTELADMAEKFAGGVKVFDWQRTDNVLGSRLDATHLEPSALNAKVAAFVVDNSADGASVGNNLFPGVDSSNMGTYAYALDGAAGERVIRFAQDYWGDRKATLNAFDPAQHTVVAVRTTFDEESLYVAYADRKSGAVTVVGEMGLVDVDFDSSADFEARTGMKATDVEGADPNHMDELDAISLNDALLQGGTLLHTGKTDDIFGNASSKHLVSATYALGREWGDENIMSGDVDASSGQIPQGLGLQEAGGAILKDAIYVSDWTEAPKASAPKPATDRALKRAAELVHRGFDYAPQNTQAFDDNLTRIEGLVKKLGKLSDLQVVEVAGKSKNFNDEVKDMGAMVFHNQKTGDYLSIGFGAP